MRLVIISPFQFRLQRGIERFSFSLANELSKRGIQVIIYTWDISNKVDWKDWHSAIKIRKVPKFRYYIQFFASIFYRFWLWMDNPDRIILNFLYHGENKLPANYNYFYVLNSPASQVPHRYSFISSQLPRFSRLEFVAVSEMVANEARIYLKERSITVIPNGVDTLKFHPKPSENRFDGTIKLISAAALEERKGIQFVIKAISQFPEFNIIYDVFGAGAYKNELDSLIAQYNLSEKVRIHAPVSNLEDVLPEYDVFCLLSKGEAFALAPLEALSCGIPVLVSEYSPFDELVKGCYGLRVNERDTYAIINAIKYLAQLKINKQNVIRQAAIPYDWQNIAQKYTELLKI